MVHRKKNDLLYNDATCLCPNLRQNEFICVGKQVVNRLKIPMGLSTAMFRRWSEVPWRGGVRDDSTTRCTKMPHLCCWASGDAWYEQLILPTPTREMTSTYEYVINDKIRKGRLNSGA